MTAHETDAALAWELLSRFEDPATRRFEAALAAAGVDDTTARALLFWHAESVHAIKRYAAETVPAVLGVLASAGAAVTEAADRAERAWAEAGRPLGGGPAGDAGTAAERTVALRLAGPG